MIQLKNISKIYQRKGISKIVFHELDFVFHSDRNYALLGRNGVGKSTLLRLIAGGELPSRGTITRKGKVSWPLGFGGGLNGSMTGFENIRFVSRIYGQEFEKIANYVFEFSELGEALSMPVMTYSSGMKARLAFGLSLAIDFDCYLIDEVIAVGDLNFRKKSKAEFKKRASNSFLIMATHAAQLAKEYCDCGLLLDNNKISYFDSVDELVYNYSNLF